MTRASVLAFLLVDFSEGEVQAVEAMAVGKGGQEGEASEGEAGPVKVGSCLVGLPSADPAKPILDWSSTSVERNCPEELEFKNKKNGTKLSGVIRANRKFE